MLKINDIQEEGQYFIIMLHYKRTAVDYDGGKCISKVFS